MRLWAEKDGLRFAGRGEDGEATGRISAVLEGEEGRIAVNARYLAECLSVMETEEVALEFSDNAQPIVFRPVGDDSLVVVCMPMFVQW